MAVMAPEALEAGESVLAADAPEAGAKGLSGSGKKARGDAPESGQSGEGPGRNRTIIGPGAGRRSAAPGPTTIELGVGWHRVVMAEFMLAILVTVIAPILTPDSDAASTKGFFKAADIVRMTAICLTFFFLALLANGQKVGKVAGAFGGLVLTGVIYNNAVGTQSVFKALAAIFTSAFDTSNAAATSAVTDPDLIYGETGANILSQIAGGTGADGTGSTSTDTDTSGATGGGTAIGTPVSTTTPNATATGGTV